MPRVLHVVGGDMHQGGIQTWLHHVVRNIDLSRFPMDFYARPTPGSSLEAELVRMGCKLIPSVRHRNPIEYVRYFRKILVQHGPYDVVHCHMHHWSGIVLKLAAESGVAVRIAHSHSAKDAIAKSLPYPLRLPYQALMKAWVRKYSTWGLAVSEPAGISLFGASWGSESRWRKLYCGLDFTPFGDINTNRRTELLAEMKIPQNAVVVGHVGRFVTEKNHTFILRIAKELVRADRNIWILLIGDGPLRSDIEVMCSSMGLADRVIFAGVRRDIPDILCTVVDIFILPSLYEGLPLTLLEAQAAALPSVVSDTITTEADVVPGLVTRLPLSAASETWAGHILDRLKEGRRVDRQVALSMMMKSHFSVQKCVQELERLYSATGS